jgi:multisubunit Na+/H+ antiporter MnhF subunit
MNEWEIAAAVLAAGLLPCVGVCAFAGVADGLVAMEIAGTIVVTALMVLAEGLQRQPFIDLALTLAILAIIATLAIARLLEHDL